MSLLRGTAFAVCALAILAGLARAQPGGVRIEPVDPVNPMNPNPPNPPPGPGPGPTPMPCYTPGCMCQQYVEVWVVSSSSRCGFFRGRCGQRCECHLVLVPCPCDCGCGCAPGGTGPGGPGGGGKPQPTVGTPTGTPR